MLVCALLVAPPALAQSRQPASPVVLASAGGYELSSEDGKRKCLVLLRPAPVPGGHGIGFPAPCKRSFPILASVSGWTVQTGPTPPRLRLRLHNATGAVLLDFSAAQDPHVLARDMTGAAYLLAPSAGAGLAERAEALANAPPAAPAAVAMRGPAPAAADPGAMRKAVGLYALSRAGGRDTGCRFDLKGSTDAGEVSVHEGCADKGILMFGAQRWSISGGTLWLTGAKGRLSFERNRKGGWDKGPGQGEALTLAPAAP